MTEYVFVSVPFLFVIIAVIVYFVCRSKSGAAQRQMQATTYMQNPRTQIPTNPQFQTPVVGGGGIVYGTPVEPQHYPPYNHNVPPVHEEAPHNKEHSTGKGEVVYDDAPAVKLHAASYQAPDPAKGAVQYEIPVVVHTPYAPNYQQQPQEPTLPYQESAPVNRPPNYASNINMYSAAQSANAMGRLG